MPGLHPHLCSGAIQCHRRPAGLPIHLSVGIVFQEGRVQITVATHPSQFVETSAAISAAKLCRLSALCAVCCAVSSAVLSAVQPAIEAVRAKRSKHSTNTNRRGSGPALLLNDSCSRFSLCRPSPTPPPFSLSLPSLRVSRSLTDSDRDRLGRRGKAGPGASGRRDRSHPLSENGDLFMLK